MDYKNIFYDYLKNKLKNNEPIDINELREMSKGYEDIANRALNELMHEGIITGKFKLNCTSPGDTLNNFESLSITQQGINKFAYDETIENFNNKIAEEQKKKAKLKNVDLTKIHSAKSLAKALMADDSPDISQITNAKQLSDLLAKSSNKNIPLSLEEAFTPEQIAEIYKNYGYVGKIKQVSENISKNLETLHSAQKIVQDSKNAINNVKKATKGLSKLSKEPPSTLYKELTKNSKSNKETESETYTFEGILGQNCGEVVTPTSEDEKRIQEKGFKVENGIKVLRGFANSAILAFASQKDENYQREENIEHLNAIEKFVENMRASAKYLPEISLIARGYEKLERINLSGTLSKTQKGELDNLEYYILTVSADKLYRIDGNHRLEALPKDNYYIPFSIIIWEDTDINPDDEAFLFYFLNSKAKKLTTEENLKGLVNATTWKPHELLEANKYLPHLQYLEEQIKTNKFLSSYFCNNEPIKNIAEVLDKIKEDIELERFKEILALTNELLICDKWNDLKIFKFYCQLVFYIAYKNQDKNVCISILDNINNWTRRYKFDNTTFDNPIMLYESAEKTNITRPIKVFVAMPYYDDEIIEDFNDQLKKLSEELIKKYPLLENRFEIYEVMKHRGYEIDIQNQIIEQIKSANIFIADVSEHVCKKGTKKVDCHANPNVMYELGIAKGQSYTEIILLKNKKDKIEVPSDIITKYHNKFEFEKKVSMRKKLFEAIENIFKDRFNII